MPMGLSLKLASVLHKWVYSTFPLATIRACNPDQPPASINPRMGISKAPAQIRMNCNTSLKIAERRPPRETYMATVADETMMLKLMSQPRTILNTNAIEYMLMPLISTVMNAKLMDESARLLSPKRSLR